MVTFVGLERNRISLLTFPKLTTLTVRFNTVPTSQSLKLTIGGTIRMSVIPVDIFTFHTYFARVYHNGLALIWLICCYWQLHRHSKYLKLFNDGRWTQARCFNTFRYGLLRGIVQRIFQNTMRLNCIHLS